MRCIDMGNQKLRDKKKKARELKAKSTVAKRREAIRAKTKHDREVSKLERKTRQRILPYVNPERKDAQLREQLEKNIEILKALEKEYAITKENKKALNDELENEGHETLKEKMDVMEQRKNKELKIDETYGYEELKS